MRLRNALCLLALGCSLAGAAQIDFSWSGSRPSHFETAVGTGAAYFPNGLTAISAADLTAFDFTYTITTGSAYGLPPTFWMIDDTLTNGLTSFSAGITNGAVSAFDFSDSTGFGILPAAYYGTSLPGWLGDVFVIVGPGEITAYESAPEPVSFALLGLGMVAIGGWRKLAALIYPKATP